MSANHDRGQLHVAMFVNCTNVTRTTFYDGRKKRLVRVCVIKSDRKYRLAIFEQDITRLTRQRVARVELSRISSEIPDAVHVERLLRNVNRDVHINARSATWVSVRVFWHSTNGPTNTNKLNIVHRSTWRCASRTKPRINIFHWIIDYTQWIVRSNKYIIHASRLQSNHWIARDAIV